MARVSNRWRTIAAAAACVLMATLGVIIVVDDVAESRAKERRVLAELDVGSCRADQKSDAGREHVEAPTYAIDPPAGGDHLAAAAPPGRFTADDTPADGNLVHAMEHGYIVIWHKGADTDRVARAIDAATAAYPNDVLVVERPSLSVPIVATAWHRRLLCADGDTAALRRFIGAFRNQGPERVPHNRPPRSTGTS